jgi:hypothetical protein
MAIPVSALSLYAAPWWDVVREATVALDNPVADPDYAAANAQTDDLEDTARTDGVIDTLTITLAAPAEVVAIFLFNDNATTVGLRSDSGLDINVPVAGRTPAGHVIPTWLWFGDEAQGERTSDVFYVDREKSGVDPLEIGRVFIATDLEEFLWLTGPEFGLTRYGGARNRTKAGKVHRRIPPWAPVRTGIGTFQDLDDYTALRNLEATANGLGQGFPIVPNRLRNDAIFVHVAEDALRWREFGGHMDLRLPLEEMAMGLSPGPD